MIFSMFISLCLVNFVASTADTGFQFHNKYLDQDLLFTIAQEHCGDLLNTYMVQDSSCKPILDKSNHISQENVTTKMPSGPQCDQAYHVTDCILAHLANWPGLSTNYLDE